MRIHGQEYQRRSSLRFEWHWAMGRGCLQGRSRIRLPCVDGNRHAHRPARTKGALHHEFQKEG